MIGRKWMVAALLTAAAAVPAAAQQPAPSTWRELLQSRIRVAYRYTHPIALADCPPGEHPANAYLATPPHRRAIGRTWLAGENQSRWESVVAPPGPDVLAVRVVGITCGAGGPGVLVEAAGYYLEIDGDQLATVSPRGEITSGILLVDSGAEPRPYTLLRQECEPVCGPRLADAESVAGAIRLAVAERQAALQREREEVERRMEAERAARARAGGAAQAGASSMTRQNLTETLQRYGATDAEARAILARQATIGMTQAMVRAALGDPERIDQEATVQGTVVIWRYPGREVVFTSGRVSAIR